MRTIKLRSCPACGANLAQHVAADDEMNEYWRFMCGGEVVRLEDGKLEDNNHCRDALQAALDKMTDNRPVLVK